MKIIYFEDTDTALLELSKGVISETKELSEDIYLDLDDAGNVVSITLEHASSQNDFSEVSFLRKTRRVNKEVQPTPTLATPHISSLR